MSGNTNLNEVLKSLQISCDDKKYGFSSIKDNKSELSSEVLATFQEQEGLTLIATQDYLQKNDIAFDGPFAKLTIEVHTSLSLVGLTATLAAQLTKHNISANVVAAFYHDHIFVQYDLKQKAVEVLLDLKNI